MKKPCRGLRSNPLRKKMGFGKERERKKDGGITVPPFKNFQRGFSETGEEEEGREGGKSFNFTSH